MGGAFGALLFALGALVLSVISIGLFLVVPFIVFIGGIIAMVISDRKRNSDRKSESEPAEEEPEAPAAEPQQVQRAEVLR